MSKSQNHQQPVFVSLSGLIGAGKTTLAKRLGKQMKLPVYHEPVAENPYLADFYKHMEPHAFAMQIYLLNERFKQQQQIVWRDKGAVQDRSIYEDMVFARMLHDAGHISERDFATYSALFANMSNFMRRPTLLVYLDVEPAVALERIRERGRECETGISLDYLTKLRDAYEHFIKEISASVPVLRVPYSEFPGPIQIARAIRQHIQTMGKPASIKPRRLKCYQCRKPGTSVPTVQTSRPPTRCRKRRTTTVTRRKRRRLRTVKRRTRRRRRRKRWMVNWSKKSKRGPMRAKRKKNKFFYLANMSTRSERVC